MTVDLSISDSYQPPAFPIARQFACLPAQRAPLVPGTQTRANTIMYVFIMWPGIQVKVYYKAQRLQGPRRNGAKAEVR